MKVGVPKETVPQERRVALVPEAVGRLVKAGHEVVVERGAGVEAGFSDDTYTAVGASLGDAWVAAVVCKVQKPSTVEIETLPQAGGGGGGGGGALGGLPKRGTAPKSCPGPRRR